MLYIIGKKILKNDKNNIIYYKLFQRKLWKNEK